ncbi:MAG: hypothetical protein FWB83_09580 [Treponema sp.]|nr:hypothetical protein [Treponema sp.]
MITKAFFSLFLIIFVILPVWPQGTEGGNHPYSIRGEIYVDFEPIYAGFVDSEYPLDVPAAGRRALDEASMLFSAMIYGWTFHYDVGERARGIAESMELQPAGRIQAGDPALRVTDTDVRDMRLGIWVDYHLDVLQQRRMQVWRTGTIRNAQAIGYSPINIDEYPGWLEVRRLALEDSARAALRAMLRSSERNRPKEVSGYISLAAFPRYYIDAGRWAVSARFRVQITEIIPFAAY